MVTDGTQHDVAVPRSVERVLDLLEIAVSNPGGTLTDAATMADLTPTTALRYLRALELRGYLDRDHDGRFHPGSTLMHLSAAVRELDPLDRLVGLAQPHLDDLAATTGESVYLVVGGDNVATYVATTESDRAIRHVGWVGQEVPLQNTAVGEALRNPGSPVLRTGAVEPDITAISLGLGAVQNLNVAVSIVGPDQRMKGKDRSSATAALNTAVTRLRTDFGLNALDQDVAS